VGKFLVVIPQCIPEVERIIITRFDKRAAWWHWSHDMWLLRFPSGSLETASSVRAEIGQLLPGVQCIVMQFEEQHTAWSGWGPHKWQEWFDTYWTGEL
jgi:hypothetical protein